MLLSGLFAPVFLIVLGLALLALNYCVVPELGVRGAMWWPVIFVVLGLVFLHRRKR
jgi:hypothetical protein